MTCEKVRQMLRDYRLGKLDAQLYNQVDQHLSECADCRKALIEDESVSEFLNELVLPDSSESLTEKLLQQVSIIEEEKKIHHPLSFSRMSVRSRWLLAGSMVALFIVIGALVFSFQSQDDGYAAAYGEVGYTWVGIQDADLLNRLESESSVQIVGGGSLAAVAGSDLPDSEADTGKITHTFDLSRKNDEPVTSDFQLKEQ